MVHGSASQGRYQRTLNSLFMSLIAEVEISPPCSELFIYYLEGSMQAEPHGLKHFIGNWQEDGFSFLFFSEPAMDQVLDIVSVSPSLRYIDHYQMSYHDWVGDKVTPFCTDRFFIRPPWETSAPPSSKLRITLDPGVVFGTGAHPTTRDCIEALEMAFQSHPVSTIARSGNRYRDSCHRSVPAGLSAQPGSGHEPACRKDR